MRIKRNFAPGIFTINPERQIKCSLKLRNRCSFYMQSIFLLSSRPLLPKC